ncbi:hypothetical protein CC85DRAFT_289671 [Cutaneotrichosporon oleaginosum]|uniref:Uncharacterized protein n=1 Tax=Cutaneotrichosporon oleaginosum TaxID=879819 RepID=A0A0J1ASE4_9TREE|nr:uncharacterized protein CC85DRAFT_289671 [Cutaneotrichosporon oleaginosum]KLT38274.1 hypothetical protein CC85DRAFT_289671 [Cutaneotrichosporon oleaginosum]TXT06898.1 hypothetical protein COLE_06229 [Cutaneotrichosporon oleaginosum]
MPGVRALLHAQYAHAHAEPRTPPALAVPTPGVSQFPTHPPSPAASEAGDAPEWLRQLAPAPADKWECAIYAAMMPEYARVRCVCVGMG